MPQNLSQIIRQYELTDLQISHLTHQMLAEMLGSFAGQVTENAITEIEIEYVGEVGDLNLNPLTAALTAGLLIPLVGQGGVNMVSAPIVARDLAAPEFTGHHFAARRHLTRFQRRLVLFGVARQRRG